MTVKTSTNGTTCKLVNTGVLKGLIEALIYIINRFSCLFNSHADVLYGIFGCMGCFNRFLLRWDGLINYP